MANEALHEKIRGLLRKAEQTPYEEEAALFFKKAQELVVKYAIDEEALWATDPSKREEIHTETVEIKDKQAGSHYRRMILNQIGHNNNCRVWYTPGRDESTIAGYPSDTVFVLMLYSSVINHMNFSMAKAMARHTSEGRSTRTFRKDFTAGYSDRIVERLMDMKREQDAYLRQQTTSSGQSTDLVLRDRGAKVSEWVNENFRLRTGSYRDSGTRDHTAGGAGYLSGNSADLSGGRGQGVSGGRKAIGR